MLLKNEKDFRQLLKLARSEGVRSLSIGAMTIEFQETKFVTPGELKPEPLAPVSDDELRRQEEELLYYSAG